jgi:regulator of cell morphogenesis and NO signaling
MENMNSKTISEFVAADYRTAAVFKNYGIDFCCKGGRTIAEVCDKKDISAEELIDRLEKVTVQANDEVIDFQSWPMDKLADYIETKHHRYIDRTSPVINEYLDKLCKVHGDHHPELFEINEQFKAASSELAMHMKKEEMILFPYIRRMAEQVVCETQTTDRNGDEAGLPGFGSVENPIGMMMDEHTIEGDRFRKMSELSDIYSPPADACNTYRVAYAVLKEFEDDLHMHIHLENNILFPRAIETERDLIGIEV